MKKTLIFHFFEYINLPSMLSKTKLQEFNEKGFVIIKILFQKQIKSIYFQIDETLSLILDKNNIPFKNSDSVDKKYLIF